VRRVQPPRPRGELPPHAPPHRMTNTPHCSTAR
jgi:hypothetical protein